MKKLNLFGMIFTGLILFAFSTYYGLGQDEPVEGWVARYNGPGNGDDRARAIAVDSEGNVYVTGWSYGIGTSYDFATIAYNPDGTVKWGPVYYNGPKDAFDRAFDIDLDSAGNVYVTGQSGYGTVHGTRCDYATIKYDGATGAPLWDFGGGEVAARYHNLDNIDPDYIPNDFGRAVAVYEDPQTGKVFVYVAGMSWGVSDPAVGTVLDYVTIKYDGETGAELWHKRYNAGPIDGIYPRSIAVDDFGNVYVTGWSYGSGTGYDAATIKYDKDGNEKWVARYNGPANKYDEGAGIAVDSVGNVYVTGWSYGIGTSYDFATIKYDTHGNRLWVARYDGPESSIDGGEKIAVDSDRNVYVTGASYGNLYDYVTIKYRADYKQGDPSEWVARYDGPENKHDYATDIALDSCGNAYVTGRSRGSGTDFDYATVVYDPAGNQVCVGRYDAGLDDRAIDIALDSCGNAYVTGRSRGSGTDFDYATIKYNPQINILMVKVESLVNTGVLNQGQGNALIAKLEGALQKLNKGNTKATCNQLQAFINQVNAFIYSGILTEGEGQPLIDAVNCVINELCG